MNRSSKKAKRQADAIAEAAGIVRSVNGATTGQEHLYYSNHDVDISHLSPRARRMLGVHPSRMFTG